MIHSVLLIGQSNMAGRGFLKEAAPLNDKNILVLRNGRWQQAFRPIHGDRSFSGVCLAESFAADYVRDHGVAVGLIPCADGGTSLDQWAVGGVLYDNAVSQARLALRSSDIAAVLWHQGEADCDDSLWPHYAEKCSRIMRAFRHDLGLDGVPFLLGGLGDYLANCALSRCIPVNYPRVNEQLQAVAAADAHMGYVSAQGLAPNPDNLHFSTAGLEEFGHRYYAAFRELEDTGRVFRDLPAEPAPRAMELL